MLARTAKNTTLQHPSTHQKKHQITSIPLHIWISLAVVCILFRVSVDALFVESLLVDLQTLESDVSWGKSAGAIAKDRHIRDRRKFAEEMLARLAPGSGRRIAWKIS